MSETQFYILLAAVGLLALAVAAQGFRQWRSGGADAGAAEDAARALEKLERAMAAQFAAARDGQSIEARNLREEVRSLLSELREASERRHETLRTGIDGKLKEMRQTVDEKLQETLEKRLGESFKQVSERLEAVQRGLGEMQSLANGVGDLKRVLTNVKTRGGWGEMQLGVLLSEILTAEQYETNAAVKPGSAERVEFAIKLPGRGGDDGAPVYLPIDSKFPNEAYERLIDAADTADTQALEAAAKELEARIKQSAKDIGEKYVCPPHTTDFAIMYLPTEGLFAEIVRRPGLVSVLQNTHRVVVAGPTTFTALLNSLQMGFRTLTVEKRSSEIGQILAEVKTEFGKFGTAIDKVKKKLQEAGNHIESVEVRSRAMDRKLKDVDVEALPGALAAPGAGENIFALAAPGDEDTDGDEDAPEDTGDGGNPA